MTRFSIKSAFPVLLWISAFTCALFPVNAYQLEFFMGAVLLIFIWTVMMFGAGSGQGWRIPKSPVLIFGALFWFLTFASIFWSEIKSASLNAFCLFSLFPLTFFTGVIAADDVFFKNAAKCLAAVFAALAAWACVQFLFLNEYFMGQARHPLADPSSLGALLSLGLFCALGWMVSDRPARERNLATMLAALLVCGVMATVARGPVFAFIPGIIVFCILLWPRIKARRGAFLCIVLAGTLFYGIGAIGSSSKTDIAARLSGTFTVTMEVAANHRVDIWSSAVDMVKDRPLLGAGFGTFAFYYPEYRRITETDGVYMAHNDPLQYWVELGVLGSFLFYAFIGAAAMRSFSALKKLPDAPDTAPGRIMVVSVFSGLIALAAHSHVSFSLYNASILMMAGFMLAAWFRASRRAVPEPETAAALPATLSPLARGVLIALPFAMVGGLFFSMSLGDYFVNRARENLFREQMFDFADNINRADRVSFGLAYRAYSFAVNVPMSILQYPPLHSTEEDKKKLYDQVLDLMARVEAANPRDPAPSYYRAKVQSLVPADMIPEGTPTPEQYYREALRLQPLQLGARMALLTIYREEGRPVEDQIALMEPGLRLSYISPLARQYYTSMSKLYLEAGDYDKVKTTMMMLNKFQRRSEFSRVRQETALPAAIMGGDALMPDFR